ncbi:unnamed protein product, partial [Vitis vinifera]|uniref:Uncharacterized protein n=1 Tax=Vitis vinifera TaxID=29760 RepID=D7T288_VITVI
MGPFSVECDRIDLVDVDALAITIKKTLATYGTTALREMIQNYMALDFSWKVRINHRLVFLAFSSACRFLIPYFLKLLLQICNCSYYLVFFWCIINLELFRICIL